MLSWSFSGAVKIWCREAYSWCNQFSLWSHSSSERAGLYCANVHTFFSNFLLTHLFLCNFSKFINSQADRSTQDWLILEKVLWQTRHSWMDMFHRWKALQQMQKGNGRHFLHKRKVMPKIVLITLLQNIAIWRNSFSNGKFGSICCFYSWLMLCICSLILSFSIWLSVNTAESAFKHLKRTHESVNKMGNEHVSTMASIIRSVVQWLISFIEHLFLPCILMGSWEFPFDI